MPLLQYLDTLLSTLCTWRVRSSRLEEFYKKGVLKYSTKFARKTCNFIKYILRYRLSRKFCEIFKNIYFSNVCESRLWRVRYFLEFLSVNILGFYYKRKRQLFYYEGISSNIPERVNRVNFQNSSQLLLLKIP